MFEVWHCDGWDWTDQCPRGHCRWLEEDAGLTDGRLLALGWRKQLEGENLPGVVVLLDVLGRLAAGPFAMLPVTPCDIMTFVA